MGTLINSLNSALNNGLFYTVYQGDMTASGAGGVDNPLFYQTAALYTAGSPNKGLVTQIPNISTGTNGCTNTTTTNFSVQWLGYFRSNYTGTWTFYTNSDDASYIWIGNTAVSGYTISNPVVNNGGGHGERIRSGTINLNANTFYPIRIQFGQGGGPCQMIVSFSNPTLAETTNGAGYYFYVNGVINT